MAAIHWRRWLAAAITILSLAGCQTTPSAPDDSYEQNIVANSSEDEVPHLHPEGPTLTDEAKHPAPQDPSQPMSLWTRIQQGLQLNVKDNEDIIHERKRYLRHPELLYTISDRSEPFLYHIVQYVHSKDMPMELVLLPFVESAFDPYAYSPGGAVGLWQFMPATAKQLGLTIDWWYDGRRDVLSSTQMALTYLQYLAKRFDGDWLLAIAAYNAGEGRVSKAIRYNQRHGKPTDFWHLRLPRETRQYVPRLLALSALVRTPDKWDLELPEVANKPQTELVDVGSQIDLALAAKLAGVDLATFHQLNSGYNRWATPPDGPQTLLLPTRSSKKFQAALSQLPKDQRVTWIRYKIRRGDSLSVIAAKFRTQADVIKQANHLKGTTIRTGKHLLIPQGAHDGVLPGSVASNHDSKTHYRVRSGDSLWEIGRRFGVSFHQLAKWNNLDTTDMLHPGQRLVIYGGGEDKAKSIRVKVRNGETLSHIAHRFHVSVKSLVQWNQLDIDKYLQPGQVLRVYIADTSEG